MDTPVTGDAEREFIEGHWSRLVSYLLHLTGDVHAAEDLAQEVCLEVLERPGLLSRGRDAWAYMRGIARHLASARYRHLAREPEALAFWKEVAWQTEGLEPGNAYLDALRRCREALPEPLAAVLQRRYDEGHMVRQIAQAIGLKLVTVKVRLLRARQQLAECIERRLGAVPAERGI